MASAEGQRVELRALPGRIAGNRTSATASLYPMQGKKGANQDAMDCLGDFLVQRLIPYFVVFGY